MPATTLPRDPVAAELIKARWLLAHLGDFCGAAHFEVATDGRAARASASVYRLLGIPPTEPVPDLRACCERFVAPDDRSLVAGAIDSVHRLPGAEADVEFTLVRPDGARRRVRALLRSFALDHGATVVLGVLDDLTGRELHQAEPLAASGRLAALTRFAVAGEMAAGLAHEMNQPLAAIANYSSAASHLAAATVPANERLQRALAGIAAEAHRAGEIVRRLRSFARLPAVDVVAIDVDALVADTVPLVQALAKRHGVAVSARTHGDLSPVHGDAVAVQLALLNLVCNAIEASAASGRRDLAVEISTVPVERGVEIAIVDRGVGFEPSTERQLFMPFYTTKPDAPGLGLAIAKSIVAQHAGSIALVNNPEGGVTARVTIPAGPRTRGK